MISLNKINNQKVKAIPIPNEDTRPIKGVDICEEVYANIFECAKKKSGKTSALFKIMKQCSNKQTKIYVFCSTIYKDSNWIEIRKYFEKKGIEINCFTSIQENGIDQLKKLISTLNNEAKEKEKENEEDEQEEEIDPCDQILQKLQGGNFNELLNDSEEEEEEERPRKPRKPKHKAPEYMIIFDDLSGELKSKSLLELLKKNRHYRTKIIISSQWLHDLLPESRKQIDLFLIFKGFPDKKMMEIYKDCDSGVPFETFLKMYKQATEKPFSFFYVDSKADKFRCNFDKQFIIE